MIIKDVFFIHSKRAPDEAVIVDTTTQLLIDAQFSVWGEENLE